jgi:hypothetical protein
MAVDGVEIGRELERLNARVAEAEQQLGESRQWDEIRGELLTLNERFARLEGMAHDHPPDPEPDPEPEPEVEPEVEVEIEVEPEPEPREEEPPKRTHWLHRRVWGGAEQ